MWALLFQVIRRLAEEPVGIIFALLVFFALRLPSQISDMLVTIVICDANGCNGPQDTLALIGYCICATVLASFVWFWLNAVNRCELVIRGGRLEDYIRKDEKTPEVSSIDPEVLSNEKFPYRVLPYRMAAATSSSMVFWSSMAAASGLSVEMFMTKGIWALLFDFLILGSLALVLGYVMAGITGDGLGPRNSDFKVMSRRRHLDWLLSLRRPPWHGFNLPESWQYRYRSLYLPRACAVLGFREIAFWGMVLVSLLGTWAIGNLRAKDGLGEGSHGPLFFLLCLLISVFVTNVLREWLAYLKFKKDPERHLTTRPLNYKYSLVFTVALATTLFCIIWLLKGEGSFSTLFSTAPSVILLAMAFAVGPLVIFLTILRDFFERLFQGIACLPMLFGAPFPRLVREPSGRPHTIRRVGRRVAVLAFLYFLFSGSFERWSAPRCDEEKDECSLYMVDRQTGPDPLAVARPTLQEALNNWHAVRFQDYPNDRPVPLVIVAASGGASRAAAWMLTVLEDIDATAIGETAPSRHIFAISSVSGGSLGAVTYALNAGAGKVEIAPRHIEKLARADLLTGAASRFAVDLMRRVPIFAPIFRDRADRNHALERAFEQHWRSDWSFNADMLDRSFLDALSPRQTTVADPHMCLRNCQPHLLINGVDVKSGRRILTSTIDFSGTGSTIPNALDFFDEFRGDINIAAAVTNSARFPLVSPAGRYRALANVGGRRDHKQRQIIDGGYYENNGIETAIGVIDQIEELAANGMLDFTPLPAILLITNSAVAPPSAAMCLSQPTNELSVSVEIEDNQITFVGKEEEKGILEAIEASKDGISTSQRRMFHIETLTCAEESVHGLTSAVDRQGEGSRVPEAFAPIAGLFGIRDSHGTQALLQARQTLCRAPGSSAPVPSTEDDPFASNRFFHIGLHKPVCENQSAPLNWVLNKDVADFLTRVAIHDPHVQWQIMKFTQFLKTPPN